LQHNQFADQRLPDGKLVDAGKHVLDALGRDPEGMAYSSALYIPMFLAAVCPKSEDTCR